MLYRRFERLIDPFRSASERMPPSEVLRFYVYFLRQVWPVFLALLVVGLIVALIEVALFSYLGRIVDLAQSTPSAEFFRVHANELIWMAVVALVLRPLFNALHDMLVHQSINPSMTNLIRWQNHRYVLKQSLGFFQNDFAGRIAQRIMQTGNSLRDSAVQVVDALWHVLIYTVSALVLFAEADWRLMIPLVLWVFAYVGALAYFVPQVKRRSVEASDSRSKLMGRIVDGYTNITTLKLFAHTRQEEDYAREAIGDQTLKSQRAGRVVTSMDVTITVMNGMLITGTTGLALWLWSQELISVGAIALATGLVIRINNMSGWIMWVVGGIFENIGQVQDGMQTIALPRKVVDREDAQPLRVERGEVEFEHIAFHYGKGSGVIQGLDLKVRPGEKIGLVGPSGAGKSTLVNLLLRLYDLESGRILVDGQDIAGVTQESLRAQIGMVTQDTSLLHRSIRDNLLYGRPGASDAELMEAVRKARADEFIPLLRGPPRLRRPCRRTRSEALRRPAPAHRHRPGAAQGRADPDPRRSDLGAGLGSRIGDPGKPGDPDAGQDGDRHRPPPVDHCAHGPPGGAGQGPHRRKRHACRVARPWRPLCAPLATPDRRLRRRRLKPRHRAAARTARLG